MANHEMTSYIDPFPMRRNYVTDLKATKPPRIVFISDLHLDFYDGHYQADLDLANDLKSDFIRRALYACEGNGILCIVGDVYNDYRKTLDFIAELEQAEILGFFVLGNHDYWSGGEKTQVEVLDAFARATEHNEYFRLLMTGRKYYVGDLCVIGDTGWTSFNNGVKRMSLKRPPKDIMGLPEFKMVKDFSFEDVLSYHNEWVEYANGIYESERNVLTLTHYPMTNFAKKQADTWWSSKTDLNNDFGWCLFGHTHDVEQTYYNHVSYQRGYGDKIGYFSFGELILAKMYPDFEMTPVIENTLLSFCYNHPTSSTIIKNGKSVSREKSVKIRGYRRCSANRYSMSALIESSRDYLAVVEDNLLGCLSNEFNDYVYKPVGLTPYTIQLVNACIDIIRRNDMSDIRSFFVAVVVTGYIYNRASYHLPYMRPLDDYDIIRFAAMYEVLKKYNVNMGDVYSIISSKEKMDCIEYKGIVIKLPVVNSEYRLTRADFLPYMENILRLDIGMTEA